MGNSLISGGFGELDEDMVNALVDNPYECPIVIDRRGIIRFMSRFCKSLINIDPENAVGKHISEVIPETRLHDVLEEGRARIGDTLYIAGRQQVISRIPLRNKQDEIIGAVGKGIFNETSKVLELHRRIDQLNGKILALQEQVRNRNAAAVIAGRSDPIQSVRESAFQAARTNASVLITGETGTGKEVIAQYIHSCSQRAREPFIRVNCAAIPQELFESELFGYEEGAFSGARATGKPGKFELARGGTIFLDEIAELPLPLQAKLLRVLQERTVDRLGSTRSIDVDFRLIAATNQNLAELVRKELFRMDLYFRVNVFQIQAPSLRRIPEDIPVIALHLMTRLKEEIGWGPSRIDDEALDILRKYSWPGNVRELRNVLERVMIVSRETVIRAGDLSPILTGNEMKSIFPHLPVSPGTLKQVLVETERQTILETLRQTGGNKRKAAAVLGIHRSALYEKLRRMSPDPT